jgi:hypothetical protein
VSNFVSRGFPLSGASPVERALAYLETMDCLPFRGLVRSTALATTSGLLLSDFDPFDSYGTEIRYMAQLAMWGDFCFVPGPIYYKRLHGDNLHLMRLHWSDEKKLMSWALLAAWMAEAIVPAGQTLEERRRLFVAVLDRFVVPHAPWKWVRAPARLLSSTTTNDEIRHALVIGPKEDLQRQFRRRCPVRDPKEVRCTARCACAIGFNGMTALAPGFRQAVSGPYAVLFERRAAGVVQANC